MRDDELSPEARQSALFAGLTSVELQDVSSLARAVTHEGGASIFSEGDDGDALYVIDRGAVRIVKTESGLPQRTLATLVAGDVFGEMALLTEGPRSASAVAEGPTRLWRIDRDGFGELIESREPIAFTILLALARLLCARLAGVDRAIAAAGDEGAAAAAAPAGWVSLDRLRKALAGGSPPAR